MEKHEKKLREFGNQKIKVRHFTTDITNLPFLMDANCYMTFSHLWRKYESSSINENLITEDGWFQYPMKSLQLHCGFKDKGTLQRTIEGLFRSEIVDVRVENGSRLWACWKMNKEVIEKLASLSTSDAMNEPYLKSITSIESKDKEFTYILNKDRIEDLQRSFGIKVKAENQLNAVENPPLFNTIVHKHYNTIKQYNNITTKQQNYTTKTQQYDKTILQENYNTAELEDSSTIPQEVLMNVDKINKENVNQDFFKNSENQNESQSSISIHFDSNRFQAKENNLLSSSENKEVLKVFKALEWDKQNLDSNTLNACLDMLHKLSQSNADNFKECLFNVNSQFKVLLQDNGKDDRRALFKALNDLSIVLGNAFSKKTSS